jgi:hypothetical protein
MTTLMKTSDFIRDGKINKFEQTVNANLEQAARPMRKCRNLGQREDFIKTVSLTQLMQQQCSTLTLGVADHGLIMHTSATAAKTYNYEPGICAKHEAEYSMDGFYRIIFVLLLPFKESRTRD